MTAAPKRTRAAFEADLQAQQSPYVFVGTPLPPLDRKVRDDGSYVPLWQQDAVDERGRKRFHGAFTGGYSAGYFNTVGSKDGWTPATFTSSRANRHQAAAQRADDFMDDEDRRDAEDGQRVQTAAQFASLGGTAEEAAARAPVMDLLRAAGASIGVALLQKMGWREGQGIGPKVRRTARTDDHDDAADEDDGPAAANTHLFAPEDVPMIAMVRKTDQQGLGFQGAPKLARAARQRAPSDEDDDDEDGDALFRRRTARKAVKHGAKGGFGTGILNDTGSDDNDDDDPYSMGPKLSYHRVLGGDKKKRKERPSNTANPLLKHKPVFVSKRSTTSATTVASRRGHDGRPPLAGFVLALRPPPAAPPHPPPQVPPEWQPARTSASAVTTTAPTDPKPQTATDSPTSARHDPASRAQLLGEARLPGKSVFAYLTPSARDKLAHLTHNTALPAAGSEAPTATSGDDEAAAAAAAIPPLDPEVARAALGRGVAGFVPYADDAAKLARYRAFLSFRAGMDGAPPPTAPPAAPPAAVAEWRQELQEFAHAAALFRPMRGMMASRFAPAGSSSSSSAAAGTAGPDAKSSVHDGDAADAAPPSNPALAAAKMNMFGPLTRTPKPFYPSRLLCKRFGVPAPAHVDGGAPPPPAAGGTEAAAGRADDDLRSEGRTADGAGRAAADGPPRRDVALLGDARMAEMLRDAGDAAGAEALLAGGGGAKGETKGKGKDAAPGVVDPERNAALEQERPGAALFRAVFGSDDEDDD